MNKKIALVDLDYTLVQFSEGMIPELKKLEAPNENNDYSNLISHEKEYIVNRMRSVFSKQGFWINLPPNEACMMLYKYIAERFETYILTKALNYCSLAWKEKVDWIHKHLGQNINIMVVTDKKLVRGDLLFDDDPRNADSWLKYNPNGRVLMPIRSHNKDATVDTNVIKWDDSLKLVQRPLDRGPTQLYDFSIPHKLIEQILSGKGCA